MFKALGIGVAAVLLSACGTVSSGAVSRSVVPAAVRDDLKPVSQAIRPKLAAVENGGPRYTTEGQVIDAHDGQLAEFDGIYYLYGTSYGCGFRINDPTTRFCGFNAYISLDLTHWVGPMLLFEPDVSWQRLCMGTVGDGGCFRPHVIFNRDSGQFVLWVNVPHAFRVLTSTNPTGPFTLMSTVAINGGDETLFVDQDGSGYVAYAAAGRIFENHLTPNYLNVAGPAAELGGWPQVPPFYGAEAPSIFKRGSAYYMTLSVPQCPYCFNTGTGYLTASTAFGPWIYRGLISSDSCHGQPAAVNLLGGSYLYQSDQWLETPNEYAATQFWAPLAFDGLGAIAPIQCDAHYLVPLRA